MKYGGRLVSTYVWLFGWDVVADMNLWETLFVVADEGVATSLGETHNVR